jgi:simple sugar transport system ATP-binding protein
MENIMPVVEVQNISKYFGSVVALKDVSMQVHAGEVMCLLGDNGAGKTTLIKTLAGVYQPSEGKMLLEGKEILFDSPASALDQGIATVYQDLALIPLMSITRNFFMGREPLKDSKRIYKYINIVDWTKANQIMKAQMAKIGIDVRDPNQAVGTLSGGERQCLAIARAVYFGAKVLILDEPTAALGVKQAALVLRYVAQARARRLGVIFITHNVHHAYAVGDAFTILDRGTCYGTFRKAEVGREDVLNMMAGGQEMDKLSVELKGFSHTVGANARSGHSPFP